MAKETGRSRQLSGGNGCREQLEALSPPERGSRDRKGLVCVRVCVCFFYYPSTQVLRPSRQASHTSNICPTASSYPHFDVRRQTRGLCYAGPKTQRKLHSTGGC